MPSAPLSPKSANHPATQPPNRPNLENASASLTRSAAIHPASAHPSMPRLPPKRTERGCTPGHLSSCRHGEKDSLRRNAPASGRNIWLAIDQNRGGSSIAPPPHSDARISQPLHAAAHRGGAPACRHRPGPARDAPHDGAATQRDAKPDAQPSSPAHDGSPENATPVVALRTGPSSRSATAPYAPRSLRPPRMPWQVPPSLAARPQPARH